MALDWIEREVALRTLMKAAGAGDVAAPRSDKEEIALKRRWLRDWEARTGVAGAWRGRASAAVDQAA